MSEEMNALILAKLTTIEAENRATLVAVTQLQEQAKDIADHEGRIRSLEHWKWGLTGLIAFSSMAVSAWTELKGGR